MPILLHPRTPDPRVRAAYYSGITPEIDAAFAMFGLGWHYDAGIQFLRLILSGAFDRLPQLQVILRHWGEVVLFYAERWKGLDRVAKLDRPIGEYLQRNLYVTSSGMFMPQYLRRALEYVSSDRLLLSTDFPYQYRAGGDARRFLDRCELDDAGTAAFAHGNWVRLVTAARAVRGPIHRPPG